MLNFLFIGTVARLPCGDGSTTDRANLRLMDVNADGSVDVSDGIGIFNFLFLGIGPQIGRDCVAIAGCPSSCAQR